MKKLLIFLIILGHFFVACEPGWEEEVAVRVLDASLIPVHNASVIITYQSSQTLSYGYTITNPAFTDYNGMVFIHMKNHEILKDRVDCFFTVNVSYDGKKVSKKFEVGKHPNILDIKLDAYLTKFKVYDQDGNPLKGAHILVGDFILTTDTSGFAQHVLSSGKRNITIEYQGGKIYRQIDIDGPQIFNISFNKYSLTINVIDDYKNPLNATVLVNDKKYTLTSGSIFIPVVHSQFPRVKVYYKGIEQMLDADLSLSQEYTVIYDFNAPNIGDIVVENQNGSLVMSFIVSDPGSSASGIKDIVVYYELNGVKKHAIVYPISEEKYIAQLGPISEGIYKVHFLIEDNQGNKDIVDASFSVVKKYVNEEVIKETDFPIFWLVVALIFVVILFFAISYIREKLEM